MPDRDLPNLIAEFDMRSQANTRTFAHELHDILNSHGFRQEAPGYFTGIDNGQLRVTYPEWIYLHGTYRHTRITIRFTRGAGFIILLVPVEVPGQNWTNYQKITSRTIAGAFKRADKIIDANLKVQRK